MSSAHQLTVPACTTTIVTCQRLSLAVCPLLTAYVADGGWAGVLRNLMSQER